MYYRLLDLQSKDYFPTTTIQPSNTANDEPQAELTVTEIQPVAKTEESFPPLYGSELVMRSLDLREFVCVCVGGWVLLKLMNKHVQLIMFFTTFYPNRSKITLPSTNSAQGPSSFHYKLLQFIILHCCTL